MSVEQIVYLYSRRGPIVRAETALTNQIKAEIRNFKKFSDADKVEDNQNSLASLEDDAAGIAMDPEIEGAANRSEGQPADDTQMRSALAPAILLELLKPYEEARKIIRKRRAQIEKSMLLLAEGLPVYGWVNDVRGISPLGLAIVVGAAGRDLAKYDNPGKLWKRFGLAPGQRRVSDAEKAIELGYSPLRRSVAYNLSESLMKQNRGEYRAVYDERKAYLEQRSPEWKKGKIHKEALRYLAKRFLRDLWIAWRGRVMSESPELHARAALAK